MGDFPSIFCHKIVPLSGGKVVGSPGDSYIYSFGRIRFINGSANEDHNSLIRFLAFVDL